MSERQPLLPSTANADHDNTQAMTAAHDDPAGQGARTIISKRRLLAPIDPRHGDLFLLVCCFVTGLIDAAAFKNYDAFAGMQTGNTVILMLSTAGSPQSNPYSWATTLISLVSFFIGCFVTARISNALGPLRRSVMSAQFFVQALLCILPAILTKLDVIPSNNSYSSTDTVMDVRVIGSLPSLAFQSGSTMATSRLLGYGGEIPVNVLTSTFAALASDPNLFALKNIPRNRRVGACVCVAVGALVSAWIQKSGVGVDVVYWLSGALKLALSILMLLLMPSSDNND